tara:strand:+ start:206 stop:439 length:234 start_codon:yes stop_codon:yes gene_type:complete
MEDTIDEKIKNIFLNIFPDENDESFTMEKKQSEFEDWDSFAHLQLVSAVEKEFGIRFDMDEVMNFTSPIDFVKYIDK